MSNNKKRISMRVDKDLWETAGAVLPCSQREFFEKQLRIYLNCTDKIKELEEEIRIIETELNLKKEKLKELKSIREKNNKNKDKIQLALNSVERAINKKGYIEKTTLKGLSNNYDLDYDVLATECKKQQYKVI